MRWVFSIGTVGAGTLHTTAPDFRSRQSVSSVEPGLAVRKRRSPQITGDELPAGTSAFQSMFDPGPKWIGAEPSAVPRPPSPRNWGQFAAVAVSVAASEKRRGMRTGTAKGFMASRSRPFAILRQTGLAEIRFEVLARHVDWRAVEQQGLA